VLPTVDCQAISSLEVVREMLGIRSGKAYFSHGPEVEYHVDREYSPDESGYVENLQS
jgi:hypothetical protein